MHVTVSSLRLCNGVAPMQLHGWQHNAAARGAQPPSTALALAQRVNALELMQFELYLRLHPCTQTESFYPAAAFLLRLPLVGTKVLKECLL